MAHIEITRDVASRFHAQLGEVFVLPGSKSTREHVHSGTDGMKMINLATITSMCSYQKRNFGSKLCRSRQTVQHWKIQRSNNM